MIFADLHCDTATEWFDRGLTSFDTDLHISARQTARLEKLYQCFAVYFDDTSAPRGMAYLEACLRRFKPVIESQKNIAPIYTVEGGGVLGCVPDCAQKLAALNVRVFGFAWNGRNALATGAYTDNTRGLSTLGLSVLEDLRRHDILPDVSHLSEQGFYDMAQRGGVLLATHSNARACCGDLRNLTDEQIDHIIRVRGLIGLNLNAPFLNKTNATVADVVRHAEHILALGGEDALALGCDFDGTHSLPEGIFGAADLPKLAAALTDAFGAHICQKILYKNALHVLGIDKGRSKTK